MHMCQEPRLEDAEPKPVQGSEESGQIVSGSGLTDCGLMLLG